MLYRTQRFVKILLKFEKILGRILTAKTRQCAAYADRWCLALADVAREVAVLHAALVAVEVLESEAHLQAPITRRSSRHNQKAKRSYSVDNHLLLLLPTTKK